MFLKKKYITCDECKKEVWPGKGVWGFKYNRIRRQGRKHNKHL